MCGFAGISAAHLSPVSPVVLKRMADSIAHRGPDGEGFFVEPGVGLAHRRLAIIDTSPRGHQPMMSHDERYVISYNGEVYNFQELRIELERFGFEFHSRTDTEVVLNSYLHWGERCLERFNGLFAFAIWDRKTKSLFLGRDRYGIKPLYYSVGSSFIVFGSEAKAILASDLVAPKVDKKALLEYFTFQNIFTARTFFENIQILPAGTFLKYDSVENRVSGPHRYWDFNFREPDQVLSGLEYQEELDRLFKQAVTRQLVSDVEIGSYLSGGMDSGSITAVAASNIKNLKTFTIGFDLHTATGIEMNFDERAKAEALSYLFKTEQYEMVLKAGDLERIMPALAWHLETPRVGQSYPNFYASKIASKFVKVALSGAGGDELFAGYPWRYYNAVESTSFKSYIDSYYLFWQRLIPNSSLQKVFKPVWNDVKDVWTRDIFESVFQNQDKAIEDTKDFVNFSLYFEAKTFLHGLLVVEDKLSMAHGLETRVPFLDNDLVDFAMSVPMHLKLRDISNRPRANENQLDEKKRLKSERSSEGKLLLRQVMERYIPAEVTSRDKQGFSAPDASWFRGESMDFVKRSLFGKDTRLYDLLDRSEVQSMVNEHLDGKTNRRLLIWSLLSVNEFLKQYCD